jgi:D-Tyr-tRNAtyr deacylase
MGIEDADGDEDIEWLSNKIVNLRILMMKTSNEYFVKDIAGNIF